MAASVSADSEKAQKYLQSFKISPCHITHRFVTFRQRMNRREGVFQVETICTTVTLLLSFSLLPFHGKTMSESFYVPL